MHIWNILAWMAPILLVSGCGGGATDDSQTDTTPPSVNYASLESQSGALHTTWDPVAFSDPATLPGVGSATYAGVMRLAVENGSASGEIAMDGQLSLVAKFSASTISGSARKFVDENNASYSGNLSLSTGIIDRGADPAVDYTFAADLAGTLSGGGETYSIDSDLSGDFHGTGAAAVSGAIVGTAVSAFGTGYLFGDFIAAE